MLYQKFKQQLLAIGVSLIVICLLILGSFIYNYYLSRQIDVQHQQLNNVAKAFQYHSQYVRAYSTDPELLQTMPDYPDCEFNLILREVEVPDYEIGTYYEKVMAIHEELHRALKTGSFQDVVVASEELHAALGEFSYHLTNYIGQLERTRTNVIAAVALPGLFLIIALLCWLYLRMYQLIQDRIVVPLSQSLAILSRAGLYTNPGEDEPDNILRAVIKAGQIIEMDNARRKLYPFWNSVFTEEELLKGSLELFGEHQAVASAAYYRYDSFTDELVLAASYAFPVGGEERIPLGVGPVGEAAQRRKPVFVERPEVELSLGFAKVRPVKMGFYPVGTPQLFGVLAFAFREEVTPEQLTVIDFFAAQLGIVIDRVRQLDDLKRMTWELGNRTRALNKELQYKDSILNSTADGIVILGLEGDIRLFNKGAEEITGYEAREAIGRNCCEIFCHRDKDFNQLCGSDDCANCVIKTTMMPSRGRELFIQHKDGRFVPILLSAAPLYNDQGEVSEILQVFKDVTELRNTLTQLEQANRSKTEFLATMSHELRTPLNAVLGFAELLETETFGPLNDRQKRYVANILTAGRHLLSLINDILDITRVEAGKLEWEYGPIDVAQVFGSAVNLLREKAVQNQLKLSLEVEPGFDRFTGDERKIKQILYNLINNAIKFTPAGGQVGVQVARDGENMLITVWDTGIGIPKDKRQAVFEPFYQVDNYLTRSQPGSGLGLALVKKMVELAGGRVWIEDEEGKSTVFKVLLPASRPSPPPAKPGGGLRAAGEPAPAAEPPKESRYPDQARKAVIIEDDAKCAELLEEYLKDMGYTASIVPTGEEGLDMVEKLKPDLVVLDILLPGMTGWEMLAALKSRPKLANIPVIVVSILEEREKGLALGAIDYLTKPVERGRLVSCVQKAVNREAGRRSKALVVDDDTKALELFNDYLVGLGVDVFLAPDPREGLRVAQQIRPDIIFLDLIMPGMDGFAFLEEKEKDPELKDIPVVVLTAKSLTPQEKSLLEQRVEYVARKSQFGREAFRTTVERIVGRSER